MYTYLQVKYPLFLLDFKETWIFLTDFQKNIQISNFTKICPFRAKLFHADGQTHRQKWWSYYSLLPILGMHLKINTKKSYRWYEFLQFIIFSHELLITLFIFFRHSNIRIVLWLNFVLRMAYHFNHLYNKTQLVSKEPRLLHTTINATQIYSLHFSTSRRV